ncbi:MAG: aminotransferase class I/II-fold pyridoxal phosphate-dependent enzyme [Chloroflexi bacterium]|jgi:aspartate/methionine/tyrosine aminotransferase|nr:aminotransferase class I/II-fold pyridoxal phosphate-dependent enzyme [Chloroflexota bacterium]
MPFTPFELEEWQSRWETTVAFNLADSGVAAVRLGELLPDEAELARLLDVDLHYPPVAGTTLLRERIAAWLGAAPENVLVTVGASEANAILASTLIAPGDEVVVMEPGYRQIRGIAQNAGAHVRPFPLDPARSWRPDLGAFEAAVTDRTKLIAATNPNNPVGTILTDPEMDAVVAAARRSGAWLLADEVYRGTERLTDDLTPTFWGRYERAISVGSLSKAFGLPGLRLGWLVAPPEIVEATWRRHEYATIATGMLSMRLGELALEPATRDRLLARTRGYIREGYGRLAAWIGANADLLSIVPPAATALGFVRYDLDLPSVEVAHALRRDAGVLVAPGATFGVEHHLRITHGLEPAMLDEAFERAGRVLRGLAAR